MKKTIAALVVATAATGLTIAYADQGDDTGLDGGHRHGRHMDQARILERYDANHNGVLDPEEKAAMQADREARHKEREARLLAKYDTNHNGVLDPEEKEAAKKDFQARRAEMLKKYDTDGDGKLSPAEREAMRKDLREKRAQGQPDKPTQD
jgi:Ca2+-binding EF-hand superfamily protein